MYVMILIKLYFKGGHLGNNRYLPPIPATDFEQLMLYILSMLHKRPFLQMRFPPRGAVASLKAVNDDYFSIMFRYFVFVFYCVFLMFKF